MGNLWKRRRSPHGFLVLHLHIFFFLFAYFYFQGCGGVFTGDPWERLNGPHGTTRDLWSLQNTCCRWQLSSLLWLQMHVMLSQRLRSQNVQHDMFLDEKYFSEGSYKMLLGVRTWPCVIVCATESCWVALPLDENNQWTLLIWCIHSKSAKICWFCFSVSKNLRKKCVNSDNKFCDTSA